MLGMDSLVKNLCKLELSEGDTSSLQKQVGFQRRSSESPLSHCYSKFNRGNSCGGMSDYTASCSSSGGSNNELASAYRWPPSGPWSPDSDILPDPLQILPRSDRSKSLSDALLIPRGTVPPPPGFAPLKKQQLQTPPAIQQHSSRYKTELCRTYSETAHCKYGVKCQFAHGMHELRTPQRHPKYKTELCLKYCLQGQCPYGSRCNFIHPDEVEDRTLSRAQPRLRQSVSYNGVPTSVRRSPPLPDLLESYNGGFTRAHSVSPPPARSCTAELLYADLALQDMRGTLGFRGRLGSEPQPRLTSEEGCCSCRCGKTLSVAPGNGSQLQQPSHSFFHGGSPPKSSSSSQGDTDVYSSSSSLSDDLPVFDFWEHNFGQK